MRITGKLEHFALAAAMLMANSVPAWLGALFSDQRFFDPSIALRACCACTRPIAMAVTSSGIWESGGNPAFFDGSRRQVQFV